MPVDLLIENVPDDLAQRLRLRAARNQRSLQDELMAIIEAAVDEPGLSPLQLLEEVRRLGIETPDESTAIIRAARDRNG